MLLKMMRKDTVVGFFPFTIPEGEYTTGLTDLYGPNSQQCHPAGRATSSVGQRDLACRAYGFESSLSIDAYLLWLLCVVR